MKTRKAHRRQLECTLVFLLAAVIGCGARTTQQESAATQSGGDAATAQVALKAETQEVKAAPPRETSRPSAPTTRVRLTQKGCIEVEPDWTTIRVGQSLSWQSEVKSPVTIHLSPGVFDQTELVVRPGAISSTGPARSAGSFAIWTTPAACQGAPRGVRGSGPGVIVEGASKP